MMGPRAACRAAWQQTKSGFTSLSGSPRDLWIMFVLKVLESYNYFSLSRSLTLFLTEEFAVSDYRAGFWYGVWGTCLTLYGFLLGGTIDFLGVRRSLVLSFLLNCTSRLVMAATQSRTLLLIMLLGPNCVAGSLGVPVMTIGIKRYTHEGNRGFAFALFYSLMNCAALTQGMLMDVFRIGLKHGFRIASLPDGSLLNNGSRLFLASGCITSLVGIFVALTLNESGQPVPKRTSSEALEGSVHSHCAASSSALELPTSPDAPLLGPSSSSSSSTRAGTSSSKGGTETTTTRHHAHGSSSNKHVDAAEEGRGTAGIIGNGMDSGIEAEAAIPRGLLGSLLEGVRDVLSSKGFWKFLCMCLFTVNLKSVFRHLDATLPKYQLRAFGCNTPIGLIYSINPAMIVLLVPIVGAMTTELQHFDMIHYGGYVSALSPFWIVIFNTEWSTAVFVAMLSLGEAIWSPRWYDYSMGVAPNGREGIFTALASAPLFAATLPTGLVSGALLESYCPDQGLCANQNQEGSGGGSSRRLLSMLTGRGIVSGGGRFLRGLAAAAAGCTEPGLYACDGRTLWLIVGCITLSSPLLVLLTQRWVRPDPRDFAKLDPSHRGRTHTDGECYDVNEADPTAVLENVYESSLLHAAERGGAGPPGASVAVGGSKTPAAGASANDG